jgi:adenylate cyclase
LYDLRRWWVPQPTGQDRRILLVPYLQETLAATSKRSPLDRAILAHALANIDKMGAKAIGIDILIDQPQPEDAQLLATLKAMKTPVWLAYATQSDSDTEVEDWQQQFMDGWFRQLAGSQVRPTSVRFEPDGDNVQRRWPSLPAGLPPLMPLALSNLPALQYQGSIDFQLPANREFKVFNSLQIDRFADPAFAPLLGGEVKDGSS